MNDLNIKCLRLVLLARLSSQCKYTSYSLQPSFTSQQLISNNESLPYKFTGIDSLLIGKLSMYAGYELAQGYLHVANLINKKVFFKYHQRHYGLSGLLRRRSLGSRIFSTRFSHLSFTKAKKCTCIRKSLCHPEN